MSSGSLLEICLAGFVVDTLNMYEHSEPDYNYH